MQARLYVVGRGTQCRVTWRTCRLLAELEGGRFFFNAVKEGDSVAFASEDENECHLWVMAMYRATGQSHKPTPLVQPLASKNSTISRMQGGPCLSCVPLARPTPIMHHLRGDPDLVHFSVTSHQVFIQILVSTIIFPAKHEHIVASFKKI